jgi:hypothetical protein
MSIENDVWFQCKRSHTTCFYAKRVIAMLQNSLCSMTRLHERIQAIFADATWGAGSSTSALSLQLVHFPQADSTDA